MATYSVTGAGLEMLAMELRLIAEEHFKSNHEASGILNEAADVFELIADAELHVPLVLKYLQRLNTLLEKPNHLPQ